MSSPALGAIFRKESKIWGFICCISPVVPVVFKRSRINASFGFEGVGPGCAAVAKEGVAADCEVGARLVVRFGFPATLETALLHAFERWDGRGAPNGVQGESIPLPTRLATLGFAAIMFDGMAARPAAIEAVRR